MAGKLVPVNAKVTDSDRNAHLSHTDWSYAIIGSDGEIVHKTTTLHGHFGVMNFKDSFPEAGTYTIKYTVLSSGPFMLGAPVPELGQTRSVVSGDLLKFAEDPTNNFGSRSFEFTVNVGNQGKTVTLEGSEPDTEISVTLSTQPERIVVGQPTTLLLDVNDAKTGEDATHVDGLLSINRGYFHYPSTSGDQPDAPIPIPLNGAYHGHRGVLSTTHTFFQPGTYMIKADLNVVPYSVPLFGETSAVFTIQVYDNGKTQPTQQSQPTKKNTVDIIGLESPFYLPNEIRTSAGETIIFDNVDGNQHTVTSVKAGTTGPDGKFDSGLLQPGEKFELTLKEKGTYHYYCALHPGMQGTIIVS
jgi:plastocyanin